MDNQQQIRYCIICGNELKPYQIVRGINTCCRSCAMRKRYQNPENRKRTSDSMKKAFKEHPEYSQNQSFIQKERLKNPEERQKISNGLLKSYQEHPEYKASRSDSMKKVCANEDYRKKISIAVTEAHEKHPEYSKRKSKSQRKRFECVEERQKLSISVAKALRTPEMHIKLSNIIKNNFAINGAEIQQKICNTKRKNGTFNSSKPERNSLQLLQSKFNKVHHQYRSQVYPFNCDFYIEDLDLFIELNFHWTHGGAPYNENDKQCKEQLAKWKEKAKTSRFYNNAIKTWTIRDTRKAQCAIDNKLNWIAFYDWDGFSNWLSII